jgi:hypothetical protein
VFVSLPTGPNKLSVGPIRFTEDIHFFEHAALKQVGELSGIPSVRLYLIA